MLTVGTVARRAGMRTSAVRYYEARGLVRPAARLPNGYRIYDEEAVSFLNFVRRAQALGITLNEVRKLLDLSRRGQQPCEQVKQLARNHIQEIDKKLRELQVLRQELQNLLGRKSRRDLSEAICPLIEQAKRRSG